MLKDIFLYEICQYVCRLGCLKLTEEDTNYDVEVEHLTKVPSNLSSPG